ncbi:hypothetical protein DSO57_1024753 [Entomophthora muscae]|uniref:Uncharacterized protein n=1 Tax=Entomophthora muscae TaxID=34485 RepID=A0ACC2S4J7_9FUNG|nr:hypothetical protein DSO57_1024753 [Entomophthora muscae]
MPSKVYQYYPIKEDRLTCVVCSYPYALDAPLSTLKKHLLVKHGFSIRNPPSPQQLDNFVYFIPQHHHTRIDIQSLLNPESPSARGTPRYQAQLRSTHAPFANHHPHKCHRIPK